MQKPFPSNIIWCAPLMRSSIVKIQTKPTGCGSKNTRSYCFSGRSAETEIEIRNGTKRMKKRRTNAGNWRGSYETRRLPIKRWDLRLAPADATCSSSVWVPSPIYIRLAFPTIRFRLKKEATITHTISFLAYFHGIFSLGMCLTKMKLVSLSGAVHCKLNDAHCCS